MTDRNVYFELVTIGRFAKATAIDAATGVEASVVGPAEANVNVLKANALRKLQFVLNRQVRPGTK